MDTASNLLDDPKRLEAGEVLDAIFGELECKFPGRQYTSGMSRELLRLAGNDDPMPQEIRLKNDAISTTRRRRAATLETTLQLAFVAGLKVQLARVEKTVIL